MSNVPQYYQWTPDQWRSESVSIKQWIESPSQDNPNAYPCLDLIDKLENKPSAVNKLIEILVNQSLHDQRYSHYGHQYLHSIIIRDAINRKLNRNNNSTKTLQFKSIQVSIFLAKQHDAQIEYAHNHENLPQDKPYPVCDGYVVYRDGQSLLSFYLTLYSLANQSIIESLRTYFTQYKLDKPNKDTDLRILLESLSQKYCQDNESIRIKNNSNINSHLSVGDPKNQAEIDPNTQVFLGPMDALTTIYQRCMTSEVSLHGTGFSGRGRTTENHFIETLEHELRTTNEDELNQFTESDMRQMFQGIKTWSLRNERPKLKVGDVSESIDPSNNNTNTNNNTNITTNSGSGSDSGGSTKTKGNDIDIPPQNAGGCCVIL